MAVQRWFSFQDVANATELLQFWTNTDNCGIATATPPRVGEQYLTCNTGNVSQTHVRFKVGAADSEYGIVGMRVRFGANAQGHFIGINHDGTLHLTVEHLSDGRLRITRDGTTVLVTSTLTVSLSTWYWIELKFRISNTNGFATLKVQGATYADTGASVDTRNGGTADAWNRLYLGNGGTSGLGFADLYFADASTDDFKGPGTRVINVRPNAAGANSAWTPTSGANYTNVDEAAQNGDTDVVATGAGGAGDLNKKDTYAKPGLGITGTVHGKRQIIWAKKSASGDTRGMKQLTRSGGTNHQGAEFFPGDTAYAGFEEFWVQDPNGPANWTVTTANAEEPGIELTTAA